MKGLRIIALLFTTIKLLVAVPCVLYATYLLVVVGWNRDDLIVLSIVLGAIGLGYPFSLIQTKRTTGFETWVIVILSAFPFCSTMFLLPIGDTDSWAPRAVALLLPILTLTDFFLSTKLQAEPGKLSSVTLALTIGCVVLSLAIVLYFAFRGRPYQSLAIVFQGDSNDLHQSTVVPTLDTPMPKGRNVVWCATLQMAWNRLGEDVLHQPPHVQGAETVVSRLNRCSLAKTICHPIPIWQPQDLPRTVLRKRSEKK